MTTQPATVEARNARPGDVLSCGVSAGHPFTVATVEPDDAADYCTRIMDTTGAHHITDEGHAYNHHGYAAAESANDLETAEPTPARLTITHTHTDGTILDGTTRNDAPTIKTAGGWRWSRNLGVWYVPNSRDRNADTYKIRRMVEAFAATGETVAVEIDNTHRTTADVIADKIDRAEDRRDALDAKAERLTEKGTATLTAARQQLDGIPFGQPIITGRGAATRRDINYRRKMADKIDRGYQTLKEAEQVAARAEAVTDHDRRLNNREYVGNRVKQYATELRDIARRLAGETRWIEDENGRSALRHVMPSEDYTAQLIELQARAQDRHDYYAARLAALDAARPAVASKDTVTKGDLVKTWHGWTIARRSNAKSVSAETGYTWADTVEWHKVTDFLTLTADEKIEAAAILAETQSYARGNLAPLSSFAATIRERRAQAAAEESPADELDDTEPEQPAAVETTEDTAPPAVEPAPMVTELFGRPITPAPAITAVEPVTYRRGPCSYTATNSPADIAQAERRGYVPAS